MELNKDNLVAVLTTASGSERSSNQQNAEAQLKNWESIRGYHFLLQACYCDLNLSLQIRWLAIICLKNGVDKYWRSTRINSISKDEKFEIRKNLFSQLDESNNQLTIQNAHTIARICRFDFPQEWNTVFEEIANILESASSNNIIRIHNTLIILNQILKVLATVRIGRARVAMQSKVPIILPHLAKYHHIFFQLWTSSFDTTTMEVSYICLKTIRRSIVDGYEYPQRDQLVTEIFTSSLENFQKLLILHENNQLELLERYLKCYIKLYSNLVNDNPTSFILMPNSKDILITLLSLLESKASEIYNNNNNEDNDFWEQMGIRSITILKKLTTFAYKKGAMLLKQRNDKLEVEKATKIISEEFFTPSLIENIVNLIITWYLKLKPSDLESWSLEPEEWVNEELQLSWEYQIRPCAENYFQDLVSLFKPLLSNFILNKIEVALSDSNIDILTTDSILSVFQLSSNAIHDSCSFDQLFQNYFKPQAMKMEPIQNKIIKRRICLIISEWISIECSKETRLSIYELILSLLENKEINDKVVKLTALQTLQHLIDDWEFRKYDFLPYLNITIKSIMNLLNELELTESKLFVLKILSILIERTNPLISQEILIDIISVIPNMWESSNNSNEMIIKNMLMRVLRDVCNSLNNNSDKIHHIVLPLIPICCDDQSSYNSLLCEDGFELWSVVLKQLPINMEIPSILKNHFQLIIKGLLNWTEVLNMVLQLVRSYCILDYKIFETEMGLQVFKIIGGYLQTMRDDCIYLTSSMIEILILQIDDDKISSNLIISNLIESGLFNELINFITRESQSPNCEIKLSLPILRLILKDSTFFIKLLKIICDKDSNVSISLNILIESLIRMLKLITDSKIRKIYILALISFYNELNLNKYIKMNDGVDLEYQLNNVTEQDGICIVLSKHFNNVLFLTTHLLEEVQEDPLKNGDCATYHKPTSYDDDELKLIEDNENDDGEVDEDNEYVKEFKLDPSGEQLRFNLLIMNKDPVHFIYLKDYIKFKLQNLSQYVSDYELLISDVNRDTLDQLESIISK
ncbi:hypothetical protein CANARDRAFT_6592 [[Candida] arabinofermentans NRRL YB-2248]|uniref:Importin N-terminal domain-containing protein n=1 Tax=[Candida] arabinofermentans NRRL YB-2248 TaxID=983967 RepID=A0A1E4T5M6_9ASCO|nr:hypothetical protein CANARDRAFT_6592 [[Candida] arabinofermentans NRRL YB-2248]